MLRALTRTPSASLAQCALTHRAREPIDVELARAQHAAYRACLADLGVEVVNLPALDALPDAVFVEDCAVVLEDVALITRPGHAARRAETASVAQALAAHRRVVELAEPATLDGGDVLRVGDVLWVGQSTRTNHAGLKQLAHAVLEHGLRVKAIAVERALHLKTVCSHLGAGALLVEPGGCELARLAAYEQLAIAPGESGAANVLVIGRTALVASGAPRTAELLRARGLSVESLELSEFQKAEAGVTCLSVLFQTPR